MPVAAGEYDDFVVTDHSVTAFIQRFLETVWTSQEHAAFVQVGVGTIAEGVELFCSTEPDFRCILRLAYPDRVADEVRKVTEGYYCRRGHAGWDVTFYSPDDPIADVLYRALREVVGSEEGFELDGYYAAPREWDRDIEDPRRARIEAANREKQPFLRLFEFLERLDDAGIWYRVDSGEGELEVQVRVPGQRYEFLFLPEGDVIYTRYTLANNLISVHDDIGARIVDELIGLYGQAEEGEEEKIDDQRLRAVYGQVFDKSLAALMEHDPLGVRSSMADRGRSWYVFALSWLLPEMRYAVTEQVARTTIDGVFSRIQGWNERRPHDEVVRALWEVWATYKK